MDEIDCCWLCWKSLPKNKKIKNESKGESELDSSSTIPCRTYLENCIKYLNLESTNLEERKTLEFKTCPLCINCLESAKKLTVIVDELEKLKRELDAQCQTFLDNLKHDRENIRLENMKLLKTYTIGGQKVKSTGNELMSGNNEESDIELESKDTDCSSLDEDNSLEIYEQLIDKGDSSILKDDREASSNIGKSVMTLGTKIGRKEGTKLPYAKSRRLNDGRSPKEFHCSNCNTTFDSKSRITEHNRNVHKPSLKCETCGQVFEVKTKLRYHITRVHQTERPYKCSVCPKSFKFKNQLKHHETAHKAGRAHICSSCGKAFFWATNLKTHIKRFHTESGTSLSERNRMEYHCDQCGKIIRGDLTHFENHRRLHTGEKPFKCTDCDEYFRTKSMLQFHREKIHVTEHQYQCKQCEMQFKMYSQLANHRARVHGPPGEPIICEDCGKSFKSKFGYNSHRSIVHDKVKHKCYHCEKMFSSVYDRTMHVKVVHTKEIELKCHICGRESSSKSKLQDHIRTHTGEKPYQCKECGKHFTSNSSLSFHRSAHHRPKNKT